MKTHGIFVGYLDPRSLCKTELVIAVLFSFGCGSPNPNDPARPVSARPDSPLSEAGVGDHYPVTMGTAMTDDRGANGWAKGSGDPEEETPSRSEQERTDIRNRTCWTVTKRLLQRSTRARDLTPRHRANRFCSVIPLGL